MISALFLHVYMYAKRCTKTMLKVKACKNEIFRVSYREFDAEFIDRFAIFLAAKLTELQLTEVDKC